MEQMGVGGAMTNRVLGLFTLFSKGLSLRCGHLTPGCVSQGLASKISDSAYYS